MLVTPIQTVKDFVEHLNQALGKLKPNGRLTRLQMIWLSTVIVGIIVTERLCWALFDRRGFNIGKEGALRWVFVQAKISWHLLLQASIHHVIEQYGVTSGTLLIDDTGKKRAKKTSKIYGCHKIKDKSTGGYINGQELVFMVLVSQEITIPIDFGFYIPDPVMSEWRKQNKASKKAGIPKNQRQPKPNKDPAYPTKEEIALQLIQNVVSNYPTLSVKAVLADALYGSARFMEQASAITGVQIISQIKNTQKVRYKNTYLSVKNLFSKYPPIEQKLVVRGGEEKSVLIYGCRVKVKAHDKRMFVIALKYEGETEYRYLIASDLSWRYMDIARAYTLRWLVEVFIQDWKAHGGWNRLAKQQGEEGSTRGVILSLLCDHLLLCHPEQKALLKNKQPGMPVGCLIERLQNEALITAVGNIVNDEQPKAALDKVVVALKDALPERQSSRHMAGRDLGRLENTLSIAAINKSRYHKEAA